jgi:CRP-like cAMP-binding protein
MKYDLGYRFGRVEIKRDGDEYVVVVEKRYYRLGPNCTGETREERYESYEEAKRAAERIAKRAKL